jgi:ABC-2 type transport system ATP-binding protein
MIQRVHLARALVAEPQVLLLDEPTNGMDPNAAFGFRDLMRRLRATGTTILLTTHDMNEAQDLCDRVLLMDQGTIIARGAPAELLAGTDQRRVVLVTQDRDTVQGLLSVHCPRTACATTVSGDLRIETGTTTELAQVLAVIAEAGVGGVSITEPDLGDVYRRLIPDREFGVR